MNTCYKLAPSPSSITIPALSKIPRFRIMSRKGSKRVGFTPDINEKQTVTIRSVFDPTGRRSHERTSGSFSSPPARLFRYVRTNVAKALGMFRKRRPSPNCSSSMVAPQRFVPPRDSYQSETLEDCIEFINSSYRKSI